MKGTFFSADFVTDNNDNLRLLEINTDTGILESQKSVFDWTDFINVLSTNNIDTLEVVYKYDIQHPIIESLSSAISANAPFITNFVEHVVPADSIFPLSPADATNKFILRLAYDESAILDSEYAKGTLSLLKLFVDSNDSQSVINFYHTSDFYGTYNTLDTSIFNGSALPDLVVKTVVEQHQPHKFYKLGHSNLSGPDRYSEFITQVSTTNDILQQYHISPSQVNNGTATSVRTFQIVYGSNLDTCFCAGYEIESVIDLPTSINFDDNTIDNLIDSKHYYEFATNTIKNRNHGLLENETILDANDQPVEVKDLVLGNSYRSYFVEGAPNTDDYDVLRQWSYSGNSLPSGSYESYSTLVGKFEDVTYANDITEIVFADGSDVIIGGEARMLVYDKTRDCLRYVRVSDMNTTDFSTVGINGGLNDITQVNLNIYDEQQPIYQMNMEDVDNFILESGNYVSFFVVHNLISGSCFKAGTKVKMADGSEKNIEEVQIGDLVLSFNEETKQQESKSVIGGKQPIHNDLVTYHFSNNKSLTCTFDHPLYVNGLELASFVPELTNKRYEIGREVNKIKVGDLVNLDSFGHTAIKEIEVQSPEDTQTYIITVEDNHNFYADNILVHNK